MGRGSIRRRGKLSWQIRFDDGIDADGRRNARWATVKGTRQDAQRELTRLLAAADAGTLPEPSKTTIAEYLREWLGTGAESDEKSVRHGSHRLSPKTAERYRELAEFQIIPHLGNTVLQRLRPKHVKDWHNTLLKSGAKSGRALSERTVGHAHRVLHRTLQMAVETEVLARNVANAISPPAVKEEEIEILTDDQINLVIDKLAGHALYEIALVDLATGMRRGEILALRLSDVDWTAPACASSDPSRRPTRVYDSRPPRPNMAGAPSRCRPTLLPCCASIAGNCLSSGWRSAWASRTRTHCCSARWMVRLDGPTS